MKIRMAAVAAAVLVAGGIVLAAAGRQEAAKGGKFHEHLKQFEGTWETSTEFKMGEEVMKSKGTETTKLVVGGLFLVSDMKSDMGGSPFEAHIMWGYDEHKKKYTGSWVDTMSTAIWPYEGSVDDAGKVFKLTMEGPNPMNGETIKIKMAHEISGKDARSLTLVMPGPDGKEMEMKINYVRKK